MKEFLPFCFVLITDLSQVETLILEQKDKPITYKGDMMKRSCSGLRASGFYSPDLLCMDLNFISSKNLNFLFVSNAPAYMNIHKI